jgi:hypothetical protein
MELEFNIISPDIIFATTDHCGTIQILDPSILPEYLLYALQMRRIDESFDISFRSSLFNMGKFKIRIPINEDGTFNVLLQRQIATSFMGACQKKERLVEIKEKLTVFLIVIWKHLVW